MCTIRCHGAAAAAVARVPRPLTPRRLQAGSALRETVPTILAALPGLWSATEGHNIIRAPLLDLVTELVTTLEGESVSLHGVLVPLVATSLGAKNAIYLAGNALALWEQMVRLV